MGNANFKPRSLSTWSEPCNKFINKYLSAKQEILECTNDEIWLSEYDKVKDNESLLFINTMDLNLQNDIFSLVMMAPSFNPDAMKQDQSLRMIELLYEQKFLEFLQRIYNNDILSLDTSNINLYCDTKNGYNVQVMRISIKIKSHPSFLVYDIETNIVN